ncbi:phage holin family protein [soil metagenome]
MIAFILRFLIGAAGLWLAQAIVPGVHIQTTQDLFLAALLLGIVNAIVRPILVVLTFPITIITLGLFLLVVNGISVALMDWLLKGVTLESFVTAILVAVVTGVVSWFGQSVLGLNRKEQK